MRDYLIGGLVGVVVRTGLVLGCLACHQTSSYTAPECGKIGNVWIPNAPSLMVEGSKAVTDEQIRVCIEGLLKVRAQYPATK